MSAQNALYSRFRPRASYGPFLLLAGLLLAGPTPAQVSSSFKLTESTFNAGGHPDGGTVLTSAGFKVSLDAIGDALALTGLTSASFSSDAGFLSAYPPPDEVSHLRFTDLFTLVWDAEGSIGDYALYRGTITAPFDPGYGLCVLPPLTTETATDTSMVSIGDPLFFLVTSRNRLWEESTKGFTNLLDERANPSPCPQ